MVDALTHLEKAIRQMRQNNEVDGSMRHEYGEVPALCTQPTKADYVPWQSGEDLRQALLQVTSIVILLILYTHFYMMCTLMQGT